MIIEVNTYLYFAISFLQLLRKISSFYLLYIFAFAVFHARVTLYDETVLDEVFIHADHRQRETSFNFRAKLAAILIVSKYMSVSFARATALGEREKELRLEFASRYRLVELVVTRGLFPSA